MFADLVSLVFPPVCACCSEVLNSAEETVCICCLNALPRTDFHLQNDNPVERIFWGRVELKKASAFFLFRQESKIQKLIHELKYKGKKQVALLLGKTYAWDLLATDWTQGLEAIVPVPVSSDKMKQRGYNQSEWFAMGLAQVLALPLYGQSLAHINKNGSQTLRSRYWRWKNVESNYKVKHPEALRNKNILLVDDVITSGATLEVCASELLKSGVRSVSILTIAYTSLNE